MRAVPRPPPTLREFGTSTTLRCCNTRRYKANSIGFYAIHGQSVASHLVDSTQESICGFLREIREANRDASAVIVVLDNFSSHRSDAVRQTAKDLDIELVHLPAYSPDLNPNELIWKTAKRQVSLSVVSSADDLRNLICEVWEKAVQRLSFARKWMERFDPIP